MRSKILWAILRSILFVFLLYVCCLPLRNPYPPSFEGYNGLPFGTGNAPESVRAEILGKLAEFQEGYTDRDLGRVEAFTKALLSGDNSLILGTMPQEVRLGFSSATRLIRADWASWGACTFYVDGAHVSASGNVAWIAAVGFVEFDLCRFLNLPLRLTGVLVNEEDGWRFQQLQYQFDLDLSANLALIILLLLLSAGSILVLLGQVIRSLIWGRRES